MSKPAAAAAPETGTDIPSFEDLASDPEIAPLLDFDPVVRKVQRPDGWTPELQRELIARIAATGTVQRAVWQMGKHATGAEALYKTPSAKSFRVRWDAAIIIGRRRNGLDAARPVVRDVPGITRRSARRGPYTAPLAPGQVYNENGLPEDEASFIRRGEEARESIGTKLLRCRRALLAEISSDPGKRAAFELLTELPIDWDKARRLEAQDDEPWRTPRMLEADMVVTAETGWFGTMVPDYGPDKIGALREAINAARARRGLVRIERWSEEAAERAAAPHGDADSVLHGWAARNAEPEAPAEAERPEGPPPSRTFGLNSQLFYDAVARPGRRAIIPTRD